MGRGRSGIGGTSAGKDTVFPNLTKVPMPGGGFNLLSNGRRVGLIDSSGGEYRYAGVFQGVDIEKTASVDDPVYVSSLRKSFNVSNWNVRSVWKTSRGDVWVTLADPNVATMTVTVEKKKVKQ